MTDSNSPVFLPDDAPSLISPELEALINPSVTDLENNQLIEEMARLGKLVKEVKPKKVKVNKFWFNGSLISKEEHDKLSIDEIRASNDEIVSSRLFRASVRRMK